jgi:hypothetical protein
MPGFGDYGKTGKPAPSGNPSEWTITPLPQFSSWEQYYAYFGGFGEVTISIDDYKAMIKAIRRAKSETERADRKGHLLDELDKLVSLCDRSTVLVDAIELRRALWLPNDAQWNRWIHKRCRDIIDSQKMRMLE